MAKPSGGGQHKGQAPGDEAAERLVEEALAITPKVREKNLEFLTQAK